MRINERKYELEFLMSENEITSVTIENQAAFRDIAYSIWNGSEGLDTTVVLSEGEKELKLEKTMDCILNPFSLDLGSRKVLNKLYADLAYILNEDMQEETLDIKARLLRYVDLLETKSDYPLTSDIDFNVEEILKLYHVRLAVCRDTLLENLMDYMRITKQILDTEMFVFVNLKDFLSVEEIEHLYDFCFYEKIYLLLLNGHQSYFGAHEKNWIYDKDMCLIEI